MIVILNFLSKCLFLEVVHFCRDHKKKKKKREKNCVTKWGEKKFNHLLFLYIYILHKMKKKKSINILNIEKKNAWPIHSVIVRWVIIIEGVVWSTDFVATIFDTWRMLVIDELKCSNNKRSTNSSTIIWKDQALLLW